MSIGGFALDAHFLSNQGEVSLYILTVKRAWAPVTAVAFLAINITALLYDDMLLDFLVFNLVYGLVFGAIALFFFWPAFIGLLLALADKRLREDRTRMSI